MSHRTAADRLIFIDTNILLNFYSARDKVGLSLLQRINALPDNQVISTYQVEMEFKKNRQNKIFSTYLHLSKGVQSLEVSPMLLQDPQHKSVFSARENLKSEIRKSANEIETLIKDTSKDPVWQVAEKLFARRGALALHHKTRNRSLIKEKALKRFSFGYPPRKESDTSCGDALNWEWIIRCMKKGNRDVIIVTLDSDYGMRIGDTQVPNDWLLQEVKDRVGSSRKIHLVNTLADGLGLASVKLTEDEKKRETAIAPTNFSVSEGLNFRAIQDVLKQVSDPSSQPHWTKLYTALTPSEEVQAALAKLKRSSILESVGDYLKLSMGEQVLK